MPHVIACCSTRHMLPCLNSFVYASAAASFPPVLPGAAVVQAKQVKSATACSVVAMSGSLHNWVAMRMFVVTSEQPVVYSDVFQANDMSLMVCQNNGSAYDSIETKQRHLALDRCHYFIRAATT